MVLARGPLYTYLRHRSLMITLIGAALVVLSPIFAPVAIAQSPDDVSKICSAARLDVRGRPGDDAILIDAAMAKRFATDDVIKIAGRGGDDSIVFSVEASDAAAVAGWLICASGGARKRSARPHRRSRCRLG